MLYRKLLRHRPSLFNKFFVTSSLPKKRSTFYRIFCQLFLDVKKNRFLDPVWSRSRICIENCCFVWKNSSFRNQFDFWIRVRESNCFLNLEKIWCKKIRDVFILGSRGRVGESTTVTYDKAIFVFNFRNLYSLKNYRCRTIFYNN